MGRSPTTGSVASSDPRGSIAATPAKTRKATDVPPPLFLLRNAAAVLTAIMLAAEERMRRGLTCCPGIKGGGAGIAPLKGTGAPFPAPYPGMGIGDTRSLLLLGRPTPEAGVGGV